MKKITKDSILFQVKAFLVRNRGILKIVLFSYALAHFKLLRFQYRSILIWGSRNTVKLSNQQILYVPDVVRFFNEYTRALEKNRNEEKSGRVLNFSNPSKVSLRGFELFDVWIPSLPEPISTSMQYVELSGLSSGMTVIDLGAYAGISSLYFAEVVGDSGFVCALEPDPANLVCLKKNFAQYAELGKRPPTLIEAAIWSSVGELRFANEGNLGSSVINLGVRSSYPKEIRVRSVTLSKIVDQLHLDRVDVIKADVEGAEYQAFSDWDFFQRFKPTIIFEPALNGSRETSTITLSTQLSEYGYVVSQHNQIGSRLPLLVAKPEV